MSAPEGQSRAALLAAARSLYAARGPGAVSAREVAREAGVNYGLVHRHFGTKQDLVAAVVAELVADLATEIADEQDPATVVAATTRHRDLWRVLAYLCLEGGSMDVFEGRHPVFDGVRTFIAAWEPDASRATAIAAMAFALMLGWVTMEPFLRDAGRLDELDADWLTDEFLSGVGRLIELPG